MTPKSRGTIFLFLGIVLLLIAGGWYLCNIIEDKNAGQMSNEILKNFNTEQSVEDLPVITVDGDEFCGKVIIDKLNVELPVYNEWNYTRLKTAPCRYTGSIDTNDIIIAAHNYKSHFGNLKKLQNGDEILFVDAFGVTHKFTVCEVAVLDGTAVSDMCSGEWDFTLFTCTKGGEQRVTVRCEQK